MKALFFSILLGAVSAFAGGPQFQIISGNVQPAHGGPFNTGNITIDYKAKTVSLFINRDECPAGRVCTMEMHGRVPAKLRHCGYARY